MKELGFAAACVAAFCTTPALAAAVVIENPAAPISNFGAPTNQATVGYTIELSSNVSDVTGVLTTSNGAALPFANLYFDLDYLTRSGSDLGFELGTSGGNIRAFIPENGTSTLLSGISAAFVGGVFTFSIPKTYFTSAIAGLTYNPAVTFGDSVRLNLSQSFSYSVAGGAAFYGADRLGIASVASVPEPAAWGMMVLGFGLAGATLRGRKRVVAVA